MRLTRHRNAQNRARSKVCPAVEHVFTQQNDALGLVVRTVGLATATTKNALANLVCDVRR